MMNEFPEIDHPARTRQKWITKAAVSLAILAALGLAFFGVYALRQPQVHRELLQRAKSLHEQGDLGGAIQAMGRYLERKPKDVAANIEQCKWMAEARRTFIPAEDAILFHFKTLSLCEASKDAQDEIPRLRARVADLLISSGRYEEAIAQVEMLVGLEPTANLLRQMARCRVGLLLAGRPEPNPNQEIANDSEWLLSARSNTPADLLVNTMFDQPGDLELTRLMAEICLVRPELLENSSLATQSESDLKQMAIDSADRLLLENEDSLDARLLHASIASFVDPVSAESDFESAIERFPESMQIARAAGLFYLNQARREAAMGRTDELDAFLDRAEPLLQQGQAATRSADMPVLTALGDLYAMRGNVPAAIEVWDLGCRTCPPPTIELHLRIVDAELSSGALPRAQVALNTLDEALNTQSPVLSKAVHRDLTRIATQYWIQYSIAKGERANLQRLLDTLVKSVATENDATRADTLAFVAASYMKIGKWERASATYGDALSLKPAEDRLLRGAALAAFRANQLGDAGAKLRLIQNKSYDDWVMLASIALESHRRRQNQAVLTLEIAREAIAQARLAANAADQAPSKPWWIEILENELAIQLASPEERNELIGSVSQDLSSLCDADRDSVELWQTAIATLNRWGQRNLAQGLLEKLISNHPDHEIAIVQRARQIASSQSRDSAREVVWDALKDRPDSDVLLQCFFEVSEASSTWASQVDELVAQSLDNPDRLSTLGRMAVSVPFLVATGSAPSSKPSRNEDTPWSALLKRIEDRIKTIEGNEGIEWRTLRAQRLLRMAERDAKPDWSMIREVAKQITLKQPLLPIGYKITGLVLDRTKKPSEALAMFQKAIALGETDVRIFERTCELLYNDGRYDEARAVLEQLGTRSNTSARAESIALQLASDQPQQLLEIAQAGVEARPSDPMAWIWYATVLVASARNTTSDDQSNSLNQAQEAIDRAVFLAPNDLRVIQAEFNHYQLTRQTDRFAGPIDRLKNAESIPAAPRYIALGRMEFATGAFDDSIASYRRAIDAGGDEVAISLLLAQSLRAQRKTGLAIDTLEAAYKISPENTEVRRMLASTLAARGNATDWSRLQLILTARPSANTDSDLELLATLYAQRGFPSDLAKAKSILDQSIAKSSTPTSQQLYRLAEIAYRAAVLHEESNEIQKGAVLRDEAEAHLARAIAQQPDDPMYRYVYTNLLIDRNRSQDALNQSRGLLQIAPEAFESHLITARSQQANGDMAAAIDTLEAWLRERRNQFESDPSNTRLLGAIGNATAGFMALGLHEQALKLLSELETISENASMDVLSALTAADDVRIRSMAVELMLRQSKEPKSNTSDRARIAVAIANALLGRKMAADQKAHGEAFLLEVQSENPDQLALQQIITNYWIVQNDIPHSIDGLRAILKIKPDDPVALNNLACALAETESGTAEGLVLIERAIAILGELPDLLDTKGLLLMRSGKIEAAIEKFEAAAKTGEDPRTLLHWYMALRRGNRLKPAKLLQPRIDVERLKRMPLSKEEQESLQSLQQPSSR